MEKESVPPQEACSLIEFKRQWTEQTDGRHPSNSTVISVELCLPTCSPSFNWSFSSFFTFILILFISLTVLPLSVSLPLSSFFSPHFLPFDFFSLYTITNSFIPCGQILLIHLHFHSFQPLSVFPIFLPSSLFSVISSFSLFSSVLSVLSNVKVSCLYLILHIHIHFTHIYMDWDEGTKMQEHTQSNMKILMHMLVCNAYIGSHLQTLNYSLNAYSVPIGKRKGTQGMRLVTNLCYYMYYPVRTFKIA